MKRSKILLAICTAVISTSSFGWTKISDFNDGTAGSTAKGGDAFSGSSGMVTYARAGEHPTLEGFQSAKLAVPAGETAFGKWGGIVEFPQPLTRGDEVWISFYMYVPSGFDYSTDTGFLKFIRLRQRNADGSHSGYLDTLIQDTRSNNGIFTILKEGNAPKLYHHGTRGTDDLVSDNWMRVEQYVHLDNIPSSEGGNGHVKLWVDGQLIVDEGQAQTISNSQVIVESLYLFTYWNGGAPQDQHLYIDHLVMTNERPNETDEWGNYILGDTLGRPVFENATKSN